MEIKEHKPKSTPDPNTIAIQGEQPHSPLPPQKTPTDGKSPSTQTQLYQPESDQCFIFGTIFFVSILSSCVGFQAIYDLAQFMYMKEDLNLRPETITFIMMCIDLPFGIKPVFGYLADILFTKINKVKHLMFFTSLVKYTSSSRFFFSLNFGILVLYF